MPACTTSTQSDWSSSFSFQKLIAAHRKYTSRLRWFTFNYIFNKLLNTTFCRLQLNNAHKIRRNPHTHISFCNLPTTQLLLICVYSYGERHKFVAYQHHIVRYILTNKNHRYHQIITLMKPALSIKYRICNTRFWALSCTNNTVH